MGGSLILSTGSSYEDSTGHIVLSGGSGRTEGANVITEAGTTSSATGGKITLKSGSSINGESGNIIGGPREMQHRATNLIGFETGNTEYGNSGPLRITTGNAPGN